MRRAVLYARVSGDDRSNSTSSLEGQLQDGRAYAKERGYTIVAELSEDQRGVSGARLDAPALNQALDMARRGEYDVLIARELDRLARNLGKQLVIEGELERAGVTIEYTAGGYDDTPEGQLNKQIRAVIAEYEREKIRERMVRGRRRAVRAGNVLVHGNTPYGYELVQEDGRAMLEIVPEQAAVVRLIYDLYTAGDSVRTVTLRLNELEIVPPSVASGKRKKGGKWRYATVRRILQSETYAGRWYYGKWSGPYQANDPEYHIAVKVPVIIERPLWEQAQQQATKNQVSSRRNRRHNYLMAGARLKCGVCHYTMSGKTGGSNHHGFYACYHAYDHGRGHPCTHKKQYRADVIDNLVWSWLEHLVLNPDPAVLAAGWQRYQEKAEDATAGICSQLEIAERELKKHQEQRERLLDLYLDGNLDKNTYLGRKGELDRIVTSLEGQQATLSAAIAEKVLTAGQIESITEFVREIAAGVPVVGSTFEGRRRVVELMDVRGVVTPPSPGREFATLALTGRLGGETFTIENHTTETEYRNDRPLVISSVLEIGPVGDELAAALFSVAIG